MTGMLMSFNAPKKELLLLSCVAGGYKGTKKNSCIMK